MLVMILRRRILLCILLACVFLLVVANFGFSCMKPTVTEQTSTDEHLSNRLPGIESIGNPSFKRALKAKGATETIKMLAKIIFKAQKHSRGSKTSDYLNTAISIMDDILANMEIDPDEVYTRPHKMPTSVCPETYNARSFSYPFYYGGFETTKCRNAVPMHKLITVVKYINFNTDNGHFTFNDDVIKFVTSINNTYKNVSILIALNSMTFSSHLKVDYPWVKINNSRYVSEGSALNSLIEQVTTPYVLVAGTAREMTNDTRLERLIREIESLDVVAAGGAFRDQNGHWRKGCFQTVYKNFTLNYIDGYDTSFHECLFCDYIQGPFVTTTAYLKQNKFQSLDVNSGLYEDWFLQTFQKGQETVVCPDSMFNINAVPRENSHLKWKYFLERWNLHKIHTPTGYTFSLPCGNFTSTSTKALSPCTLEVISEAVKWIMGACEQTGIVCEIQAGTALGAVKMGKALPWDIDFDVRFVVTNCTRCKNIEKAFKKAGLFFEEFVSGCCAGEQRVHAGLLYKGYNGDFNGVTLLDSDMLTKAGGIPTTILFDGQWINVPRNPGLFVRNRYGKGVYQHAEHWRVTGGNNKHAQYAANIFLPCVNPGRHECLDRYNADGNIQFIDMLP